MKIELVREVYNKAIHDGRDVCKVVVEKINLDHKIDIDQILILHGIETDSLYKKTNLLVEADVLECIRDVSKLRAALLDICEKVGLT